MDQLLISIIVPAYNIRDYLGRCLDSLLVQTYTNLEIIVIDDGSTDGTADILDFYAAKDRRIIALHTENSGVSSARMEGISKARGDFIGFCDGDDFVEAEMFEHLLWNALKYKADISHCGYKMVFPDGHIDLYYGTGQIVQQSHEDGLKDLLKGEFVEPGLWNKLYKRSIVEEFTKALCWDKTIRINEDLLMNYILFSRANNAIFEDIPYYHYMLRKGSAATSKAQRYKLLDPLKVQQLILQDLQQREPLYSIALERELRLLINIAQQTNWIDDAKMARDMLRGQMKLAHTATGVSYKVKLMAICVTYMPLAYRLIRRVYDRISGNDRKYSID